MMVFVRGELVSAMLRRAVCLIFPRCRWPEVGAGLQNFEMPCPRCTIDFDTACEIYAMAIAARANPSLHFTPSPSPELNWPSRRTPDIPDDFRHGSPTPSLASSAYSDSDSDSDSSTWSIPSERDWAELTPILADEDEEEDVEWTEYALLRGEQQASKDRERVVEGEREVVEFEPNVECEEVEEVEVEEDGPSASPASGMTLRNEYWGDDEYGQDYGYAGSWGDEDYGPEYGWARERPSEEFEVGYDLGYGAGFEDGYEQARRDTEVWMQQGGWRSELDRAWAQGGEAARRFYEGLGYFDGEGEQEGR